MRNLNRLMAFYDGLLNGINSGKGCIYKINLEIDIEKLKNIILNIDGFINKFDTDNELWPCFFSFAKKYNSYYNMKGFFNIFNRYFLGKYCFKYNSFPFPFLMKGNELIIYNNICNREIPYYFLKFKDLLYPIIKNSWKVSDYNDIDIFLMSLRQRLSEIEKYFMIDNGTFIKNFMENLPDKVSKKSFETYLDQRFYSKIHRNINTIYPVLPPKITQNWRNERLTMQYNLPSIHSVSESSVRWFYYSTYKLEQYAISGVVEAERGDVVIDAGAFVGDTAMYFAQKVGMTGKVYAFEPIKNIISIMNKNIKENNMDSIVEAIPYALSDINKTLYFIDNGSDSSSVNFDNYTNKSDLMEVKTVSLDSFVQENNIRKVDFLKADLEGADVDFVKGALKTIARDAPKCGLTVYHKPEDFIAIPKLLMSVRDDYVFYFRCESEPVIFAKKKE